MPEELAEFADGAQALQDGFVGGDKEDGPIDPVEGGHGADLVALSGREAMEHRMVVRLAGTVVGHIAAQPRQI